MRLKSIGLLLFVLPAAPPCQGQATWERSRASGFEAACNLRPGTSARVVSEAVSFSAHLRKILNLQEFSEPKTRIVFFASEQEFRKFRNDSFSSGFFQTGSDMGWIGLHPSQDALRALRHELVHSSLHNAGIRPSPWLAEGLAEYLSAVIHPGSPGKPGFSAPIPGHLALLGGPRGPGAVMGPSMAPLDVQSLLSPTGGGEARFYAQSWLLVSTLAGDGNGLPLLIDYAQRWMRQPDQAQRLFSEVFGLTPEQAAARAQVRFAQLLQASPWRGRAWPDAAGIETVPMTEFDSEALLGALAAATGSEGAARISYERARRLPGSGPERAAGLGMLALLSGNVPAAMSHMADATRQGSRNPEMWFEYAMLMRESGRSKTEWLPVMKRSAELDSSRGEAWFVIGEATAGLESVAALERAARSRPPKSHYWESYGRALLKAGEAAAAAAAAEQALALATRKEETAMARSLLEAARTPALRRSGQRTPVVGGSKPPVPASQVRGRLVDIDCSLGSPVLIIQTAARRERIAVTNSTNLDLRGAESGHRFTCGPQRIVREVTAGHNARPDPSLSSSGELMALEFH